MNTNETTSTMTSDSVRPVGEWFTALSADTQAEITDMVNEQGYPLHDIQEFVETYGEQAYINGYYVAWCELTEQLGVNNDAIEAFVEEYTIGDIYRFEEAYMGQYDSEAEFAEEYFVDTCGREVPEGIVVDWEATWDESLSGTYTFSGGYVFAD